MRIYIIGFTSAGKTTFGKQLSKQLNLAFVDLDFAIQNKYGKTVQEIFSEKGEMPLREIESKVLYELSSFNNIVLSTGGGAPCFYDNMQLMNQTGISVYLKGSMQFLLSRLKEQKGERPLIQLETDEQLKIFVSRLLAKRERYYNMAHIQLDAGNPDIQKIVNLL
jgi:shikimate kinase